MTIESISTSATTAKSPSSKDFKASLGEIPTQLLRRVVSDLAGDKNSSANLAGKVAIRIASALCRGSYLAAKAVVDQVFPILLGTKCIIFSYLLAVLICVYS